MCKPKIKKMGGFLQFITGDNIAAITLAPFGIYVKEKYLTDAEMINHESIHWKQQMEMLILFFYLWYFIEWFLKLILPPYNDAYNAISFEREAYDNENNLNYLEIRKHYCWIKRIFN
jgi:integral membrane sensor domain MASE1